MTLITLLLVKATSSRIRQSPSTLDNLFRPQVGSELGGLCIVQGPQNTCDMLRGTPRHTSTLHVSPVARA